MKKLALFAATLPAAALLAVALSLGARAQTTAEMVGMESARFEKADRRLNAAFKKLLALEDGTGKAKLRKAQRAWIVYRDAESDYASDEMRGGSGAALLYAAAQARTTEARAAELERTLKAKAER